ncbi:MAG: hypothetical protein ASARMPREDX12_004509 [Alectoria sarmentosa]|nr:MAG: hypothetical protein ASARMPREDX12_004509 [Alectoria sarmentosa]
MIAVSGIVGTGIFVDSGEILRIAGPGGALVAFAVVGLAAVAALDGHAEMIGLFPIANAKVKFVEEFVDKDLAGVVGFAYWYTYAMGFASIITTTLELSDYWYPNASTHTQNTIQIILLYITQPLILVGINLFRVRVFGIIETVAGILKLLMVLGVFILLICINVGVGRGSSIGGKYFIDDFQAQKGVAMSKGAAVCAVIPIAAYAFVGVEMVSAVAVEARHPRDLHNAANYIAPFIAVIYILLVLMFGFDVPWTDPRLPPFYEIRPTQNQTTRYRRDSAYTPSSTSNSSIDYPVVVIAALIARIERLPSFLVGASLFAAVSAANTALYVASRSLYGVTKDFEWNSDNVFERLMSHFGITNDNNVPHWAIVASAVAFGSWIPALHFAKGHPNVEELQEILSTLGTVGLKKNKRHLESDRWKKYNLWLQNNEQIQFKTILVAGGFQPFAAWVGLIFSFLTVVLFNTASWWHEGVTALKFFTAYAGPIAILLLWLGLKVKNHRWNEDGWGFVRLGSDPTYLTNALGRLEECIEEETSNGVEMTGGPQSDDLGTTTRTPMLTHL